MKKDDHLVTTSIPSLVPAVPTCSSGVSYESSSNSRTHHYSSQSPGDLYGCRAYSSTGSVDEDRLPWLGLGPGGRPGQEEGGDQVRRNEGGGRRKDPGRLTSE